MYVNSFDPIPIIPTRGINKNPYTIIKISRDGMILERRDEKC